MNVAACQAFADLGGECVDERKINRGDTYVTAVLRKIARTAPDVLYLILSPAEASLILAERKAIAGLENTAIIVQELSFEPYFLELSGESAIGVYLSQTSMQHDRSSDAYQTFLLGYRDRFAQEPTTAFHAFGYDAAAMLLNAIQLSAIPQADGGLVIDREAILAHMFATRNFPGLTGSLTCSPTGDCGSDALGGIVYLIESGDPSTWNPGVGLTANPVQVWPNE
jgi:branched-chain amino acid transport system substrate-binding protein